MSETKTDTQTTTNSLSWRWRYDPSLEGKRDLRLDFLRGIAICFMSVNHLESHSYFNNVTHGHIYATAAEGFVFLSGFVLGMVTLGRIKKGGWRDSMKKLLERAWILYRASFVIMAVLGLLTIVAPGWTRPCFDTAPGSWWQILLAAATFHLAPPVIDILQLYVLCLVASPGIFWLLRKGLWLPVLAISWSLWGLQQTHPYAFSFNPIDRDHPYFAFASWQLLYVHGLLAGYYRSKVQQVWNRIPKVPLLIVMAIVVVAAIAAAHYDMQLGIWPTQFDHRVAWLRWTDRSKIGTVRIVTLFALFSVLFCVLDAFWQPLYKAFGKVLVPLGQNSLYVYIVHVPATVIWFLIPGLVQGSPLVTTVVQAVVIAFFWLLVKKQVLFNIIPR